VLESFDRTVLVTGEEPLRGKLPTMDDKAVNYPFKTPGGDLYHSGDSHYSIRYAKHGKEHPIDVALGSYSENPVGNQDKMTSVDILRMAEALGAKVVIPFHHDVWTNFKADPLEILMLWNYKKNVLQYRFKPFLWDVGGKFTYPHDAGKLQYHYGAASRTPSPTSRTCRSHRSFEELPPPGRAGGDQPGEEFRIDGLAKVHVEARGQGPAHLVGQHAAGERQEQHVPVAPGADGAGDLEAGHPRHAQVAHHHVRRRGAHHGERAPAVVGHVDEVPVEPEHVGQRVGRVGVVVHHQHAPQPAGRRRGQAGLGRTGLPGDGRHAHAERVLILGSGP
jgi:hypothetical protein